MRGSRPSEASYINGAVIEVSGRRNALIVDTVARAAPTARRQPAACRPSGRLERQSRRGVAFAMAPYRTHSVRDARLSLRPARSSRSACSPPLVPPGARPAVSAPTSSPSPTPTSARIRPAAPSIATSRRRAPLHDVPAGEEHRDHRVRLREVDRRHQRRQVRVLHRQAPALDDAPLSGGAQGGDAEPRGRRRPSRAAGALAQVARRAQMDPRRDRRAVQGARREALRDLQRARECSPRRAPGGQGQGRPHPPPTRARQGKPAKPPPKTKSAT